MKQKDSAIMQMLRGNRGNFELMTFSEEYNKALDLAAVKTKEFKNELEKYPELLALYNEIEYAEGSVSAVFAEEVYREAFAFGLAMGQEVFGRNAKGGSGVR